MSTSRDSSVWRSLAVAFGDGLAFGVGMKLTQAAGTKSTAAVPVLPAVAANDRVALLEERIRRIERAPAALPAPGSAAPAKFDQQVLDALVNAVETRLQEQASATERRMADLEARLALELKAVHEDVQNLAAAADARIRETESALQQDVAASRREISELATGRRNDAAAIAAGLEKLGARVISIERNSSAGTETAGQHVAEMAAKVDQVGRTLVEGYETLRGQVADFDRKGVVLENRFTAALAAHAEQVGAMIAASRDRVREEMTELERRVGTIAGALTEHQHASLTQAMAAGEERLLGEIADVRRQGEAIEAEAADRAKALAELRARLERMQDGIGRTVDTAVLAGMEDAERRLVEQVRETSQSAAGLIARDAEGSMERRIAPLAAAVAEGHRAIAELQAKAAASDAQVLGILQSVGQAYLEAARRATPPAPVEVVASPKPPEEPPSDPANDSGPGETGDPPQPGAPLFGEGRKPARVWRIPLVSSFVMGAAGLAWLQFIA